MSIFAKFIAKKNKSGTFFIAHGACDPHLHVTPVTVFRLRRGSTILCGDQALFRPPTYYTALYVCRFFTEATVAINTLLHGALMPKVKYSLPLFRRTLHTLMITIRRCDQRSD